MIQKMRLVKPQLFTHEGLFEAERDYQLPIRLAFISLFTCCDREGRFRWQLLRLKAEMLPYDNVDINGIFEALMLRGFIKKYKHQGEWYGCIPSWSRHQYIHYQREPASVIPSMTEAKSKTSRQLLGIQNWLGNIADRVKQTAQAPCRFSLDLALGCIRALQKLFQFTMSNLSGTKK